MSARHYAWCHPHQYRALELIRRIRPALLRGEHTRHDGRPAFGVDLDWVETLHAMVLKRKALELIGWPDTDPDCPR